MPAARSHASREAAHFRWAARYNAAGNAGKAAAHFGRAMHYARFGTGEQRDVYGLKWYDYGTSPKGPLHDEKLAHDVLFGALRDGIAELRVHVPASSSENLLAALGALDKNLSDIAEARHTYETRRVEPAELRAKLDHLKSRTLEATRFLEAARQTALAEARQTALAELQLHKEKLAHDELFAQLRTGVKNLHDTTPKNSKESLWGALRALKTNLGDIDGARQAYERTDTAARRAMLDHLTNRTLEATRFLEAARHMQQGPRILGSVTRESAKRYPAPDGDRYDSSSEDESTTGMDMDTGIDSRFNEMLIGGQSEPGSWPIPWSQTPKKMRPSPS
jgi:hypothetical protein